MFYVLLMNFIRMSNSQIFSAVSIFHYMVIHNVLAMIIQQTLIMTLYQSGYNISTSLRNKPSIPSCLYVT